MKILISLMDTNLKSAEQLFHWNRQRLSFGGIWPLETNYVIFYLWWLYLVTHWIFVVWDFIDVLGDMPLMIENIPETTVQLMVGVKMVVLRYSIPLKKIVNQVEAGAREENYRDQEEKSLYLEYIAIGRAFFRTGNFFAMGTALTYHFSPLEIIVKAAFRNETIPYVLPYRMRLFFNITESRTYGLVYLSLSPMIYYYYVHTITVCFLCTLIVHVAGELSVLAHRIRHINEPNSTNDWKNPKTAFRKAVERHQEIIESAETIDNIFNIVLLEELLISMVLFGLPAYSILMNSEMVTMIEFFFLINYSMAVLVLILVYCITGDFLLRESINVHDAYYECRWYDMPSQYRNHMIICMARAQKPLQLTAGRFYVFSLSRFSDVLKTSMAYISMLRAVV